MIPFDCNDYRRYEKLIKAVCKFFDTSFITIFQVRFFLLVEDELALLSLFDAWLDNFCEILNWLSGDLIFLFVRLVQQILLPVIFFIAHGFSMLLISIFGQEFWEIVIPNWSKRSRPRMGLNPSATTVIFAFWIFQSLQRTGVFRVPRVSTILFEKDFNSSDFF